MKKILLFFSLLFMFILTACNSTNKTNDNTPKETGHKNVSYAILTNEESIMNKGYKVSDFNLESLSSVIDCNELNNINNVDLQKYKKILKFTFNNITDTAYKNNVNLIKNDKRIEKYCTSDNVEFEDFNYASLEKNIEYLKIEYKKRMAATGKLNPCLINSIEKRDEYVSYLTNLGKTNEYLVNEINKYNTDYYNENSLIIIVFELPTPNYYYDFDSMLLNDNKLALEFNRYHSLSASIQVISYSYLFIEIPNKLTDVELTYNVNNR